MHPHGHTKSRSLSRQKSTSSDKSSPSVQLVHIHPDAAEHAAQSAAIQAFKGARERASRGIAHWPPPRANGRSSLDHAGNLADGQCLSTGLSRQRSVRFVQPHASREPRQNAALPCTPSRQTVTGNCRRPNHHSIQSFSSASAVGIASAARGTAGDYIDSLFTGDDYYTPEDDIASEPSSYRRLRKSQSMYNGPGLHGLESYRHEQLHTVERPDTSDAKQNHAVIPSNGNLRHRALRAPKSMSFLSSMKESSAASEQKFVVLEPSTELPKHLALDHCTYTVPSHCSSLLRPRFDRPDKAFRKTLRHASNSSNPLSIRIAKDGSLRLRAREVSRSLKCKLRNFFNIAKGDSAETSLPPQQVTACKTHVTNFGNSFTNAGDRDRNETEEEPTAISRVTSGVPSLHSVHPDEQLRSRQGSLESLRSEGKVSDENSRVTSWSNSDRSMSSTVNSARSEWEKQRLSVINENEAHIAATPQPAWPFLPRGAKAETEGQKPPSDEGTAQRTVDSQRIYSALMKKLAATKPEARTSEEKHEQSLDNYISQGILPTRGSSKYFRGDYSTEHTSRRRAAEHQDSNGSRISTAGTIIHGEQATATGVGTDDSIAQPVRSRLSSSLDVLDSPKTPALRAKIPTSLSARSMTGINTRKPASVGRTLSERSSAFFGSPACHLFRTQSPYRRAIRGSMQAAADSSPAKPQQGSPWVRPLSKIRIRCPSGYESEEDRKMTCSESEYSVNYTEASPSNKAATLAQVAQSNQDSEAHGDATIFLDPPTYMAPQIEPATRAASSTSSVEWKSWLSSNVSRLTGVQSPPQWLHSNKEHADSLNASWISGHVRENAQTNGEDEDEREPARGNDDKALTTTRSGLRSPQSLASLNSATVSPKSSITSPGLVAKNPRDALVEQKQLVHARSLSALGSRDQNIVTHTTLTRLGAKHCSPEEHRSMPMTSSNNDRSPRKSTKFLGVAEQKIFPPVLTSLKPENIKPSATKENDPYGISNRDALDLGADLRRQSPCTKHMVELFLDSRRRRVAGVGDSDAFI